MPLILRPLTFEDLESYRVLDEMIHGQHVDHRPDVFRRITPQDQETWFQSVIGKEDVLALGAFLDGQLAGAVFAPIRPMSTNPRMVPSRIVYVDTLVVDDRHQAKGIGRRLMEAARGWAIEQKAQRIALSVWNFNESAIAFYLSLGYRTDYLGMSMKLPADS